MVFITISISVLALLVSGVSLYFQFFHRPRRVRVITLPAGTDNQARLGICNAGKESIYITGLSVCYSIETDDGLTKTYPIGKIQQHGGSIINSGRISEFSYRLQDPPTEFLDIVPETIGNEGQKEKKMDIVVQIQFAFPDGTIFFNNFKSGSFFVAEDLKGSSIYGVNLSLLKSALPVLRKKT